jgi:hypothetical protein
MIGAGRTDRDIEELAQRRVAVGAPKLFTFTRFRKSQWKSIRTLNAIVVLQAHHEGLHEEFKRRIKTQTTLPPERVEGAENAAMLLWALLASGQITKQKVDDRRKLAERPFDQIIDLAARSGNLVPPEIAPKQIPTASPDSTLKRSSKTLAGRPPEFNLRYSPGFPPLERAPRIS